MSAVEDETHAGHDQWTKIEGGREGALVNNDEGDPAENTSLLSLNEENAEKEDQRIPANGTTFKRQGKRPHVSQDHGVDSPPPSREGLDRSSSADGSSTIPDDTPSKQGSLASSPSRGGRMGSYGQSPTPSLRPFDRRFQSRLSSSPLSSRPSTPAFLTAHSRNSSAAYTLDGGKDTEVENPWEVVRWTKLKKMTGQAFSEVGKRNFGRPTCIAVSASIALGTSKGIMLIFDYSQNLKSIIGPGTKAVESGAVTAISISADHSTIAGGHASGSIFTWEVAKPAKPFLHIPPVDRSRTPTVDGHGPDAAILHLGFLGIRHTALSSADDKGMAFSHLATRGMGMVARSVKTTRILGRYPDKSVNAIMQRKPSSVLSFSPLPLGNAEHAADTMGLVAMLTPYLLVLVSTTPIAQTQFKAPRPKEVASHSAMTGALAWFPSVKLKTTNPDASDQPSKAKLVYCWSNILTVLEVNEVEPADMSSKSEPPSLQFRPRSRWKAEESIVAVQWLGRSVLAVLTITQQLVILEDVSMNVTDTSDLIQKHIYQRDLFSKQLNQLVDELEDEEVSNMHGVVADAFYMSFRAYKGRLFLLGHNEISFGTLSNWADRLMALVEEGSYVRAIELATGYYTGDADKVTVGLPEDDDSRHGLVREKVAEMITASLKYAFGRSLKVSKQEHRQHLDDLAEACIVACISIKDMDFLFDDVYAWYQENHVEFLFLEHLEPAIDEDKISVLPPEVIKDLVSHYTLKGMNSRLEEILCLLDPRTMDIDQITTLCKKNHLYDALLYVWNQALGDYTTILSDLLITGLLEPNGHLAENETVQERAADSSKVFPYLSYILTGRIYPIGKEMPTEQANLAKADVYNFFFSGRGLDGVPRGDIGPQSPRSGSKTNFPNLRTILDLDAPSFLSMLNEAFEDSFLNGPQERLSNETPGGLTEAQKFGLSVNRQWVVSILLEVMTPPSYDHDDTIYLDMFIARNLPKFPQFILLPGHVLHKVLVGLCHYPSEDVAEDCQLSVEYLLSMYQPPDLRSLIPVLHDARFYRVLKGVHKADRQYAKLLEVCFEDQESPGAMFEVIGDCLRPRSGLSDGQVEEVRAVIAEHAEELVSTDVTRTASTIEQYAPDLHAAMLTAINQDGSRQYLYLQVVLEPTANDQQISGTLRAFIEQYVRLLCEYNPSHVRTYVDHLKTGDLRIEEVLPSLEDSGAIDAAVVLMAREGKVREGIDRLTQHLRTLEAALLGILDSEADNLGQEDIIEETQNLIAAIQKYARVGVWICQAQTHSAMQNKPRTSRAKNAKAMTETLSADEALWLDIIDTIVTVTKTVTEALSAVQQDKPASEPASSSPLSKPITDLRSTVQETFTALLTTTTTTNSSSSPNQPAPHRRKKTDHSFLLILRAFLTRASLSSPSLSSLRAVLTAIFSAYAYEQGLLSLSNKLLDQDLFVHVNEIDVLRRRGWRPLGQVCGVCGGRVWGPGAGEEAWNAWVERVRGYGGKGGGDEEGEGGAEGSGKGKGKGVVRGKGGGGAGLEDQTEDGDGDGKDEGGGGGKGAVVIFACRHLFHRRCVEALQQRKEDGAEGDESAGPEGLVCPLCT